MTESRRQQNPDLKLAVDLIADNRIQSGFRQLQAMGSIVHVSPEDKLETIANEYMAASPEARSQTLVLAGTNKERLALTQVIRSRLQQEGSLGQDTIITQLLRKDLTKVQMENPHHFSIGEVVMPTRDYKRRGLEKGKLYTVVGKEDKALLLQGADGNEFEVDTKFEKAVYVKNEIAIAVGDILRWRKNNNELGRSNGEDFIVTAIDGDTATIKYLEGDKRTETLNLKEGQSLDYALVTTVYSSQGKTAERVLVADDDWAMKKESFYVAASRAKQELKIYTHDSVDMLERVKKSNTKQNALEVLREQVREKQAAEKPVQKIQITACAKEMTVAAPVLKTQATVSGVGMSVASPILKKDLPAVASPVLKSEPAIELPLVKPILKQKNHQSLHSPVIDKPTLKPQLPTKAFWTPQKTEAIPNFIEPKHWQELENSAIHPAIAALNFESLQFNYTGGEHEVWERLMVSEKLKRTNAGRLSEGFIQTYSHLDAGGWWCDAGVDPRSFAFLTPGDKPTLKRWGCYKPNMPRPKKDEDGQVIEGKFIKYEHPPKVELSIFLLDVPQDIAERIYSKHQVNPTERDRQSGFWYCVWKYNIPCAITEGAKKAASLLSQGHAAIGLPGISAGYRSPKDEFGNKIGKSYLHEELAVFATQGREIKFCFDYETKPETKVNIERDISVTGSLLQKAGAKVKVVSLPGPDKGVDDFIMAQGSLTYEKVCHEAMSLRDWRHNQKQRASMIEPPRKLTTEQRSLQQNPKEQTDDRQQQQPQPSTVIDPEDRGIIAQPRETEHENRAVTSQPRELERENFAPGNKPNREPERVEVQSLELLAAINRHVELQEIFELGGDIERINSHLADGWLRGQGAANNSRELNPENSAIIDRTESYGHPQQPASEQLLNAITDFLETAAIESTNIVKDLQALTKNLGHYQNKDSVSAIILDVAAGIADFIDQSAVETALVEGLSQVTEQLSQYQQQLASGRTALNQLEHLLSNQQTQNQAVGAIAGYVELQAIEAFTVESVLSKLIDQLKQLPQYSPQEIQQTTDNLLKAIFEHVEQDTITTSPAVSALEEMKTQLEQSQSHGTSITQRLQTLIEKLGHHQNQQLESSMKEILLGLDKQELISLVSKVSDYFEQPHQHNDPHLSEMEVIRQLIRDEKTQIVEKLNSPSELELEAEILELSEEIALLEEIELLEAEIKSESRSQNREFRI